MNKSHELAHKGETSLLNVTQTTDRLKPVTQPSLLTMTDCHADFLAEITSFLQTDALDTGFPIEEPRVSMDYVPVVADNSLIELDSFATDQAWPHISSSSDDEAYGFHSATSPLQHPSTTGTKRAPSDERTSMSKRRQIYRQRAKSERESLRYEATQLSKKLATLMERFKKSDKGLCETNSISAWKTIALCLQEERQHAERKRSQLRSAVESQRFFISEFGAVLLKQLTNTPICDQITDRCTIEQKKDTVIFRAHVAELDANYACTDKVFATNGMDVMVEKMYKSIDKNPDGVIKSVQYRNKQRYPFEFHHTRDALWELCHLYNQQNDREAYTDVTNQEDTYAFKYRVTRQLTTGTTVSILNRFVIRRYTSENEMVMVLRLFSEGEGIFSGMHSSESGWIRFRPCEAGTTMEMYVKLVPMNFPSTTARLSDAVSMMRKIEQDNEACVLNGLASFSLDDNCSIHKC